MWAFVRENLIFSCGSTAEWRNKYRSLTGLVCQYSRLFFPKYPTPGPEFVPCYFVRLSLLFSVSCLYHLLKCFFLARIPPSPCLLSAVWSSPNFISSSLIFPPSSPPSPTLLALSTNYPWIIHGEIRILVKHWQSLSRDNRCLRLERATNSCFSIQYPNNYSSCFFIWYPHKYVSCFSIWYPHNSALVFLISA